MNAPAGKRPTRSSSKPSPATKPARSASKRPAAEIASPAKRQGRARIKAQPETSQQAGEPETAQQAGEPETAQQAVERALADIEITPQRAVLAATVRRLAVALDLAEPTDVAKVSRELAARMAELMAEARPHVDDDDWTAAVGAPALRDATQLRPGDARAASR
jgi:predicted nucleic acid-binding protein